MKVVSLSALCTGHFYLPRNIPGTHFCWRLSHPQGQSAAGRFKPKKNSNVTIGNRTRDLLACSAVQNKLCHRMCCLHGAVINLGQYSNSTNRYVYIHGHGKLYLLVFKHSSNFVLVYAEYGFGGLGIACWPLVPKFAGANPAEAVGFLGRKNSSARLPSEGK